VAANAAPNRHDFILALNHAEKVRRADATKAAIDDPQPPAPVVESEVPALRLARLPAMPTPSGS
jgi:hypothetical protein